MKIIFREAKVNCITAHATTSDLIAGGCFLLGEILFMRLCMLKIIVNCEILLEHIRKWYKITDTNY